MDCNDPQEPEICVDGTYPNSDSVGCRVCEPGFSCHHGIKEDCPPGTYCNVMGMIKPFPCTVGHYCKGSSQFEALPCPEKMFSEVGWPECKSCPAGFFCDDGIKQECLKGNDYQFSGTIFYFRFLLPVKSFLN